MQSVADGPKTRTSILKKEKGQNKKTLTAQKNTPTGQIARGHSFIG
jgi:hypothetical protein